MEDKLKLATFVRYFDRPEPFNTNTTFVKIIAPNKVVYPEGTYAFRFYQGRVDEERNIYSAEPASPIYYVAGEVLTIGIALKQWPIFAEQIQQLKRWGFSKVIKVPVGQSWSIFAFGPNDILLNNK